MYVRSKTNYETVIPPMRTFSSRWIVQSPANNIDTGAVTPGGLNRVNCPAIRALPPVDRDTKYSRCKLLTEKITDVMSLQPSTTYRLAMTWLEDFHVALHTGKLDEFTGHRGADARNTFHNLSQISVPDSVTLSQLSFADQGECPLLEDKQPVPEMDKSDSQEKAAGPAPATSTITSPIVATEGAAAESKATDATDSAPGSASAPVVFASPPRRRGLSRHAAKKEESRKEMKAAKRIIASIREGRKTRSIKLSHMEILNGPYSRRTTMPLVERLGLPPFEITGVLAVVKYSVGQAVPVIKVIPQAERLRHAIQAIDETNNHALLARWDDYGYATYDQLKLMEKVVVAKNNFALVQATVDWIETVEFQVEDIVESLKDTLDITKVNVHVTKTTPKVNTTCTELTILHV
ncbi:hypothetical protein PF007_g29198 [Phytophthora fragariae]|uniref:Uncharacterized protein n=2 Tax=Phytophthora fragariae TaxID=53985 RepID=A0A6A3PVX3_9STRA|nr:hypothetical protein PF007_g29198 [Phytophthora fragariae]